MILMCGMRLLLHGLSLGVDRAASVLTPDGDHSVELMAGANA